MLAQSFADLADALPYQQARVTTGGRAARIAAGRAAADARMLG